MAEHGEQAEVDTRFLVPGQAECRSIARLTRIGPYPLRRHDAVQVRWVYLDTSDGALARHGVALGLCRAAGRWEAVVEWHGAVDGVARRRPELAVPLPRRPQFPFLLPQGPLRVQLAALVAGRPLHPALVCDVRRRRIDVLPAQMSPDAAPVATVTLDQARLRRPDGEGPYDGRLEAEIGCSGGEQRDITSVVLELRRTCQLVPSRDTTYARGLALARGRQPPRAKAAPVRATDTIEQVARKVVARHLERLRRHDPGTRLGDPDALHDMRVETRRLRAALRAFNPAFPRRLDAYLRESLPWLARLLGGVRDLDVQMSNLRAFSAVFAPDQGLSLEPFHSYLAREHASRRGAMLGGLESGRYYELIRELEHFAERPARSRSRDPVARQPIAVIGRRAIKKAFRGLLRRGGQIPAVPAPQDLHALRIRAKRARYLLEFLRDLTGKPGRRLVRQLMQLQDLLGSYHDAVVAADFVRAYVEGLGPAASPASLLALGALVGSDLRLAEQKRSEFQRTWKRFTRKRALDELQEVLKHLHAESMKPRVPRRPRVVPLLRVVQA